MHRRSKYKKQKKQRHASQWVDLIEVAARVGSKLAGLTLSGRRPGAAISIPSSKSNSRCVPRRSGPEDLRQGLMLMCVMCRLACMFGHGDQASEVRPDLRSRSFQRKEQLLRLTRCRAPRCLASSRSLMRLAANIRPSKRSPRSLSIPSCQLWALNPTARTPRHPRALYMPCECGRSAAFRQSRCGDILPGDGVTLQSLVRCDPSFRLLESRSVVRWSTDGVPRGAASRGS